LFVSDKKQHELATDDINATEGANDVVLIWRVAYQNKF